MAKSSKPAAPKPGRHLRATDLRGAAHLATQATLAVTTITEGVHQSVWRTLGAPSGTTTAQTRGLTGLIYQSVKGVTQLVGQSVNAALTRLEPLLDAALGAAQETPEREAVLAALNGVMGDRLADGRNPLATVMSLRYQGQAFKPGNLGPSTQVSGKVLLLIHGLCMNDLQWHTQADGVTHSHGQSLADALGYTPIYLRYNTGLHTSENGHQLAQQLGQLLQHWPVPLEEISVLAHSMGGLVIRSAVHSARQQDLQWTKHLKNIVFLGTPHHGAPLERAGNWIDVILGSTPYSRPFAKLGQLRSAGITDLRYGHVLDAHWQGHDRFRRRPDSRQPLPLPEGVACYAVAASTAGQRSALAERLIGDGLVPLNSALGLHEDSHQCLLFAKPAQRIFYRMNHMEMLHRQEVTEQLMQWLRPR
jgi:pimeloyl-ACP methyl ester carboxylesterase